MPALGIRSTSRKRCLDRVAEDYDQLGYRTRLFETIGRQRIKGSAAKKTSPISAAAKIITLAREKRMISASRVFSTGYVHCAVGLIVIILGILGLIRKLGEGAAFPNSTLRVYFP
jgi:hypothetical protein